MAILLPEVVGPLDAGILLEVVGPLKDGFILENVGSLHSGVLLNVPRSPTVCKLLRSEAAMRRLQCVPDGQSELIDSFVSILF